MATAKKLSVSPATKASAIKASPIKPVAAKSKSSKTAVSKQPAAKTKPVSVKGKAAQKALPAKSAPMKTAPKAVIKAVPKAVAAKAAPARAIAKTVIPTKIMETKTIMSKQVVTAPIAIVKAPAAAKGDFKVGSFVVYPTHGVGNIIGEETQTFGEVSLKVFVINFERDKMTLRVPVHRAEAAGLRCISGSEKIEKALKTLKGKAKAGRGMWSRRAQEYEAKINSGCLLSVAEVVRDLYKNVDQSERSYSERIIFESAFNRMVGELAAAEKLDTKLATEKLVGVLKKQAA